jgi:HK97 family phage major capsid protein
MNGLLERLNAELKSLTDEAMPLAAKANEGTLTADEDRRLDELVAQIDKASKEQFEAEARSKQAETITQLNQKYSQPASKPVERELSNTAAPERQKSIGRRFAESEQLKTYAENPVKASGRFDVGSFHTASHDDMEEKTLVYTGATSSLIQLDRQPGIFRGELMPWQVSMRDVIPAYTTTSNSVEYVRELLFTNAAAETAEAVSLVTGAKPESALTFEVVNTPVQTIAHWVPVTRQVLQDVAMMEAYINNRLLEGLRLRENDQIVAGNGTTPNLRGLMNTSGIGNLDAAYWTANPLPTVGAAANNLDRLRRAIKYIAVNGLVQPNFVVLHPDDMEKFDELKTSTGEYLLSGPLNFSPIMRLWRQLVVVENTAMTAGNFLVGYGPAAGIFDRMDAQIFVADQHSDFFIRNIFVVLAEERLALAVFRPAAFAKGVFA